MHTYFVNKNYIDCFTVLVRCGNLNLSREGQRFELENTQLLNLSFIYSIKYAIISFAVIILYRERQDFVFCC